MNMLHVSISTNWRLFLLLMGLAVVPSPAQGQTTPNPKLPSLFIVGDSTANNNAQGARGWGDPFIAYFDATRINVLNRARAGRSSRTFITEGLWDKVLAERELCDKESGSFVMAWPLRCAASLRLAERLSGMSSVSDQARGQRPLVFQNDRFRQVGDLPRIGVAEPCPGELSQSHIL